MRICYVASADEAHRRAWIQHFAAHGHEVHVISLVDGPCPPIMGTQVHYLIPASPSDPPAASGTSTFLSIHLKKPLLRWLDAVGLLSSVAVVYDALSRMFLLLRSAIRCRTLLRRIQPDVVHGHFLIDHAFLAACGGRRPLIVSAGGSDVLLAPHKSILSRLLARFTLNRASRVVVLSNVLGDALMQRFNVPATKLRHYTLGVDCRIFSRSRHEQAARLKRELGIDDSFPIIISPRNIASLYRILSIIEVIPHILRHHPRAAFLFLAGYGSHVAYVQQAKRLAAKLGINNCAHFVDRVLQPEEVSVYLNAADILVSIPKSESYGSSVLEGMACGLIPIVSDTPAMCEIIRDRENGYTVP